MEFFVDGIRYFIEEKNFLLNRTDNGTENDKRNQKIIMQKINRFMERHDEPVLSEGRLKYIIDLYDTWYNNPSEKALYFARMVVHYIFRLLYQSNFTDPLYVAKSLMFHHESSGFLDIMNVHYPSPATMLGHQVFEYFIRHTNASKLTINGHRLLEYNIYDPEFNYIYYCSHYVVDPKMLQVGMRYGGIMSVYNGFVKFRDNTEFDDIVSWIADVLRTQSGHLRDSINRGTQKSLYTKIVRFWDMILRDIPNWIFPLSGLSSQMEENEVWKYDIEDLDSIDGDLEDLDSIDGESDDEEDNAVADPNETLQNFSLGLGGNPASERALFLRRVLSNFKKYFRQPMYLRQLCRISIRQILNTNWQLPDGIYKLPLPELLQKYLDVQ